MNPKMNYAQFTVLATSILLWNPTNAFSLSPAVASSNSKIFLNSNTLIKGIDSRIAFTHSSLRSLQNDDDDDEASQLRKKAEQLRQEVQDLEKNLDRAPRINMNSEYIKDLEENPALSLDESISLRNKRILVVGANGRLGAKVCRYLLRNYPQIKELLAAVHTVSENSRTSRGYGNLSYEVGAEDGRGNIGAAWSAEDRVATFEYTQEMESYNLNKLRLIEVELLDPVQCRTITEDVDCVIYCATDFNGNKPRAISGLNVAFLFRALADPTKGRVEIEGLRNLLEGLTSAKQDKLRMARLSGNSEQTEKNEPNSFILVSTADQAFSDFETPFGSFKGIKREGEQILEDEFPSLSKCILQMSRYDDNFIDENLDVQYEDNTALDSGDKMRRKINSRDAAKFTVDALVNEDLSGKKVEVWTALR